MAIYIMLNDYYLNLAKGNKSIILMNKINSIRLFKNVLQSNYNDNYMGLKTPILNVIATKLYALISGYLTQIKGTYYIISIFGNSFGYLNPYTNEITTIQFGVSSNTNLSGLRNVYTLNINNIVTNSILIYIDGVQINMSTGDTTIISYTNIDYNPDNVIITFNNNINNVSVLYIQYQQYT